VGVAVASGATRNSRPDASLATNIVVVILQPVTAPHRCHIVTSSNAMTTTVRWHMTTPLGVAGKLDYG
jgi:hypothetical protein